MVRKLGFLLVFCVGLSAAFGGAAPEDFALKTEIVSADTDTAPYPHVVLVVGSWTVDEVQGWSWGLRHDKDAASIGDCPAVGTGIFTKCDFGDCGNVECPDEIATAGPDTVGPEFNSVNVLEDGLTMGVVCSILMAWTLPADDRFEMMKITYEFADENAKTDVAFAEDLGDPTIDTVFVHGGLSIAPATQDGIECIGPGCGPGPDCTVPALKLHLETIKDNDTTVDVAVLLDTIQEVPDTDPAVLMDVSAVSFGLKVSAPADVVATGIVPGEAFANWDVETEGFWGVEIVDDGITLGMVVDLQPDGEEFTTLPHCKADQQIAVATFQCKHAPPPDSATADISLDGTLGTPARELVVDVDGTTLEPEAGDPVGVTIVCEPGGITFVRADVNQDGRHTVSDAVAIAKALFNQGSKLPLINACKDAADVNDDGNFDSADPIFLLNYLFTSGPVVPGPIGTCGLDTTNDALTCDAYTCNW